MTTPHTPDKEWRRIWKNVAICTAMFFGAMVLCAAVLWIWMRFQTLDEIGAHLDAARPWLAVWRGLLFAVVIGGWSHWINALARRQRWSDPQRHFALRARWPIAMWWIIIELTLVQNMIGRMLSKLSWS